MKNSRTFITDVDVIRFLRKVEYSDNGCWVWIGAKSSRGYGTFTLGTSVSAHRTAYEIWVGPIPEDLFVDHLCRNTVCVNPDHLEAVTNQTNVLRGDLATKHNAGKTHCPKDHEYTQENTYVYTKQNGRQARSCKACKIRTDNRSGNSDS